MLKPGILSGALAVALLALVAQSASATLIVTSQQIGTPAPNNATTAQSDGTLTGLVDARPDNYVPFNDGITIDFSLGAIPGNVIGATFTMDVTDGDGRVATLLSGGGVNLGSFQYLGNNGTPGPWRAIGGPNNVDHPFVLPSSVFNDLEDGDFQVNVSWNGSGGVFGSNRAILSVTSVPEPASIGLGLLGCTALVLRRRRTA